MRHTTNPNVYSQFEEIVPINNSLFAIATRTSDNFVADADVETKKKRDDKIAEINTEIDRRKTAFETI